MKNFYKGLLGIGLLCFAQFAKAEKITFTLDGITYSAASETADSCEVIYGSDNNTGYVVIPSDVTYGGRSYTVAVVGDSAFYNCSTLTSVTFPESLISIGYRAFYGCSSLTSITIPKNVRSIGGYALYSVTSVTCLATTPPECPSSNPFSRNMTRRSGVLRVPEASVEAYEASDYWGVFNTVEGIDTSVGIANVATDGAQVVIGYNDLEGRPQKAMQRGLNVVRYKDGTTKKIFVR